MYVITTIVHLPMTNLLFNFFLTDQWCEGHFLSQKDWIFCFFLFLNTNILLIIKSKETLISFLQHLIPCCYFRMWDK